MFCKKNLVKSNNFKNSKAVIKQHLAGFTLIELLVVIAIIGLLATIVTVSTKDSRDKAKLAKKIQTASSFNHRLGAYLVNEWRFNEGSGMAYDSLGDVGCTLLANSFWSTDCASNEMKPCLSFNAGQGCSAGYNKRMNLGGGNIAITAWIKLSQIGVHNGIYVYMSAMGGGSFIIIGPGGYGLSVDENGRLVTGLGACNGSDCPVGNRILNVGEWYFVGMSYDNNSQKVTFYIDGEEDAVRDYSSPSWVSGGASIIRIGVGMHGNIDELRIYNNNLTQGQIKKMYAEGLLENKFTFNKD